MIIKVTDPSMLERNGENWGKQICAKVTAALRPDLFLRF